MHEHKRSSLRRSGLRSAMALALIASAFGCRDKSMIEAPEAQPEVLEPPTSEVVSEADEPAPTVTRTIDDTGITRAVERELLLDHLTPAQAIVVQTNEGIVELTGTVDNLLAKNRATRLAEVVRGVRSVSNRITVTGKDVPDDELVDEVRTALLYDPVTESYEMKVNASDGTVTLTGTVGSWAERRIAERVAASVSGVEAVVNEIEVRYERERADAEISREIERRLAADVLVDQEQIRVDVRDGIVELSGTVGSAAERTRAESQAWTAGVNSVSSENLDISVTADDPNLRKRSFVLESETEIAAAVRDAMLYDPRVDSFEITPVVRGTTVTLQGTVDNLRAKRAAEQLARNTVGVARVVNEIAVVPGERVSDEEAAEAIRSQLLSNVYTDAFEIQVDVEDGVATLTGTVDDFFEKAEAGDIASRARGVVDVNNLLQVAQAELGFYYDPYLYEYHPYVDLWDAYTPARTTVSDAEIEDEIEDELFWSPFVDSEQVRVRVSEGVATLTGTVDTWREREAASENAYEGGALYVTNLLHVEL